MRKKNSIFSLLIALSIIGGLTMLVDKAGIQWDLTSDQRYTLSESTKKTLSNIQQPISIDVLIGGDLPSDYQRLQNELTLLLRQFQDENDFIQYVFVDPFEGAESKESLLNDLYSYGLTPELDVAQENQSTEQTIVVPWMILNSNKQSVRVSLLQKNLGDTQEERIEQSIQQMEYHLLDGIHQLTLKEKKRIAVLSSHGTSEDRKLVSLLQSLLPYYNIASFDLKAFPEEPQKTLENLNRFHLLFVSNPSKPFNTPEKFILDQYTQQGGNSLFLIDPVTVARDSLFLFQGDAVAYPAELELDELFFKYGVRFNKDIITDLYSAPIVLAQGENSNAEYRPYPWVYHPLVEADRAHPIGAALGNVHQQFVSSIDTLKNTVNKTVLLATSNRSKRKTPPFLIQLEEATKPIKPSKFDEENYFTGVLLEGKFPSLFANRIAPFEWQKTTQQTPAKIAVFSDGNMAENQLDKGTPLELGYDKWTNNLYTNKVFLQNTIHFLMGEIQRLNLRSKEIRLAFLDTTLVNEKKQAIQLKVFVLPLVFMAMVGFGLHFYRQRKYRQ